jgi:mono/diheme cytochrome c family protein
VTKNTARILAAAAVALAAAAALWTFGPGDGEIAAGRALYAEHCASCHGANLEGQPNWQEPLPNGRMPAPPHDGSGHTWHHPDEVLFRITREGVSAVVPGYDSDMPAFQGVLSDDDIRAVLAFIKSTWSERARSYQQAVSEAAQ